MKENNELNPLQKLFVRKQEVSTKRLREFYGKMVDDPQVPEKFKLKRMTPERMVSEYLEPFKGKNDLQSRHNTLMFVHEYEENGKNCKLNVYQGYLGDFDICYTATRFILEKDGEIINDTTLGANLFDETEIAEIFEYARIMYGEKTYAYLMELAAQKIEVLPESDCDASDDLIHRTNQGKFNRFMKLDKIARRMYKEVKEINKEDAAYSRTRKYIDMQNDFRRMKFEDLVVVNPRPVEPDGKDAPPRVKTNSERILE